MNTKSLVSVATTCSYVSPADGCHCCEPVWPGSQHGFCIGHSRELNKPIKPLQKTLQRKFQFKDFVFDGYVFPHKFILKRATIPSTISFWGCTFLDGIHFEDVEFSGPLTTFQNCMFFGSQVYLHRCQFTGKQVHFHQSVFEGDLVAFNHCRFHNETADFSNIHWRSEQTIAFYQCQMAGNTFRFEHAKLDSPLVVFKKNQFQSANIDFSHSEFHGDRLVFSHIRQSRGNLVFDNTRFASNHVEFNRGDWKGNLIRFYKSSWKGSHWSFGSPNDLHCSLLIDHCHFDGDRINYAGIVNHQNDMFIRQSHFKASHNIDFSNLLSKSAFSIHHSRFTAPEVLFENSVWDGPAMLFQKNRIEADRISFHQSRFVSKNVSFCRCHFQANEIDWSQTYFENRQTSFQRIHIESQVVTFKLAQFLSHRTSFHLAQLLADHIRFDLSTFGNGNLSFWKANFGDSHVSFYQASSSDGLIRFANDLRNVHFNGNRLNTCEFDDSVWPSTGILKRVCVADESGMLITNDYNELIRLYRWIAEQYKRQGMKQQMNEFYYAAREVERLEKIYERDLPDLFKMELSRWMIGYGLGFYRTGFIRGAAILSAALYTFFTKLRY